LEAITFQAQKVGQPDLAILEVDRSSTLLVDGLGKQCCPIMHAVANFSAQRAQDTEQAKWEILRCLDTARRKGITNQAKTK
jgi:hypothetical protein